MNDHSYCTMHDKTVAREPFVSERRIRLRARKKKQRTRINIGVALPKWMSVMVASGFQSNTEVAFIVRSVRESVFSRFANEYFKKVVTLSTFAHAQM